MNYNKYQTLTNSAFKSQYSSLQFFINTFYPIGVKVSNENYRNYVGQKALNLLIEDNILNAKNFKQIWEEGFLKKLSDNTNYKVIGATYGLIPNFAGKILLKQSKDLILKTELCFYVSFINNFYSIQIVHSNKLTTYKRDVLSNVTGYGIDKIIVSPMPNENQELFRLVDEMINSQFKDAKFLPFKFDLIKLENFEVPHAYNPDFCTSISSAFFQKGILLGQQTNIIGDINYKLDELYQ